jgi:heptosyltransferase I
VLLWGSEEERLFAEQIGGLVAPKLSLYQAVSVIAGAKVVVGLDTGLGHITACLNIPCVSLYGSTSEKKIGYMGQNQSYVVSTFPEAPCYKRTCENGRCCMGAITTEMVINTVQSML